MSSGLCSISGLLKDHKWKTEAMRARKCEKMLFLKHVYISEQFVMWEMPKIKTKQKKQVKIPFNFYDLKLLR